MGIIDNDEMSLGETRNVGRKSQTTLGWLKIKSAHEREQLIKAINVLLNQAYDSTLDEIYAGHRSKVYKDES